MPMAKVDDGEIYYEEHGSGFPLMLVSGLGGVGSYWEPQIRAFSEHYRVIVHDHRGTGRSSKSRIKYSLEKMAGDTLGVMDALGIKRAHLVGHSTGGAIGQILAVDHPERLTSVVMYATWTKADAFFRRCFEVRRELLRSSGPRAYVRGAPIFLHPSWWIRDNIDTLESADSSIYGTDPDADIIDSRIDAVLAFDLTDRLGDIPVPVLVLGVRNDHLTPAYYSEELARLIPGAKLVILEDGGHVASQTVPETFNRIVLDHLSTIKGSEPLPS